MKKIIKKLVPRSFVFKILGLINRLNKKESYFVKNINIDLTIKQKKVAICHVDIYSFDYTNSVIKHTNIVEASIIIKLFIDYNYCIDIYPFDCKNVNMNDDYYDIVFGLGDSYKLLCDLNKNSIKIIYLCENSKFYSDEKFQKRLEYFKERHSNTIFHTNRSSNFYNDEILEKSDYGIFFGNDYTSVYYKQKIKNLYLTSPSGLINNNYINKRNVAETKNNFLYFGSYGALHKGLDLLIDTFNEVTNIKLWIAGVGYFDEELLKLIKNRLNFNVLGFIDVNSDDFLSVANQCSFIVMPSCSEAKSTSVLTCMLHGLIPIITKEVGIDIDINKEGFYIENIQIDVLKKQFLNISNLDDTHLNAMHEYVVKKAIKNYSINNYRDNLNTILLDIINK